MITSCLIIINKFTLNYRGGIFLKTVIKISIQPVIKLIPPMGVIAPIQLIPVTASTYKLPENNTMPDVKKTADHFSIFDGYDIARTPTRNNPSA